MPWCHGYAPVPIVAWAHAVTDGKEPITAFVYVRVPSRFIRFIRFGHDRSLPFSGLQWRSTFHPPPSITNVTITFGGFAGCGIPGSGTPSGAAKSKPISFAAVGARSARVTRS